MDPVATRRLCACGCNRLVRRNPKDSPSAYSRRIYFSADCHRKEIGRRSWAERMAKKGRS